MFERRTDDEVDGETSGEGDLDGPGPEGSPDDAEEPLGPSEEARADVAARRAATKRRMDEAKGDGKKAKAGTSLDKGADGDAPEPESKPKPGTAAARAARNTSTSPAEARARKSKRTTGGGRATADDPTGTKARRETSSPTRKVPRPSKRTGGAVDQKAARSASARSGNPKKAAEAAETSRYTAPIPRSQIESPTWVPVLMFSLLGLGGLVILLTYIIWDGRPLTLGVGLALILGGILTATQYR